MADILIRSIEMPKENDILVFDVWHGKVYARSTANTGTRSYEVVPLPEGHGNMIDVDALEDMDFESCDTEDCHEIIWRVGGMNHIRQIIKDAPIIVPAEGETDDGN